MAIFNNTLAVRYRRFRAYHEHTYPLTFFILGVGKTIVEIGIVGFVFVTVALQIGKIANGEPTVFSNAIANVSGQVSNVMQSEPDVSHVAHHSDTSKARSANVVNTELLVAAADSDLKKTTTKTTTKAANGTSGGTRMVPQIVSAKATSNSSDQGMIAVYDHNWLQTRPSGHFVIQLASSPRLEKLMEFASALDSDSVISVYPFKVSTEKQQLLYGLSIGEYPTLKRAMAAAEQQPLSIKRYGPWVRRLVDLQKDIKTVTNRHDFEKLVLSDAASS